MSSIDLRRIMKIEVPFVVVLGQRPLKVHDILNWVPGSIIELGKDAEEDLEIRVNNKCVGNGTAVKVGENFGVQFNYIGDPKQRIEALRPESTDEFDELGDETSPEAAAAALLDEKP
ncbi:MAG: flagellar motor switch protein FliN [Phycisphaerae bacterium]|nr:flagellar motor switch protein FliN [Phycisphaerae bacterium]MBM91812.1 flagellar motor switch protein FliN [Phycisphaerae bacterium]HCT46415.1 flagellar motor switch protein FliN [Phycisphaerales bacterium]